MSPPDIFFVLLREAQRVFLFFCFWSESTMAAALHTTEARWVPASVANNDALRSWYQLQYAPCTLPPPPPCTRPCSPPATKSRNCGVHLIRTALFDCGPARNRRA